LHDKSTVIIIGGGLAGLSAGVLLAEHRIPVLIIEAKSRLGGRASSFQDSKTGDIVDYGQHLMIGAYKETEQFLKKIGSFEWLDRQDRLRLDLAHPCMGVASVKCADLPAPFHLLTGLSGFHHLTWFDKFRMFCSGGVLYCLNPKIFPGIDYISVDTLLRRVSQSKNSRRFFWDILTLATLNEHPQRASAALFLKVIREAFLFDRARSQIWLPKTGLSELYTIPAENFIKDRGGQFLMKTRVDQLCFDESGIQFVETSHGRHFYSDFVISAVPARQLRGAISDEVAHRYFPTLDQFTSSAIIGIHLWWDRPVMKNRFVGLLESPIEWVFDKSQIYDPDLAQGSHLSLVISAANRFVSMSRQELTDMAVREIRRFFPLSRRVQLVRSLVIKNRRATFAQQTGTSRYRLDTETRFPNFLLAGDWTNTGLPATIESAVMSGHQAAKRLLIKVSNLR